MNHRGLCGRGPDLARTGTGTLYSGVSNCQMNAQPMPTKTKTESNQRTGLERVMVSSLSGVHQVARLADHLQPTPQRASVVQAIRLEGVIRKERFAPREKEGSMLWTTAGLSVVGTSPRAAR